MNIKAKQRLSASSITASFNPALLIKDGLSDSIVNELKALNSKVAIKYAQFEAEANTAEAYIYPSSDSVVGHDVEVFTSEDFLNLAKSMARMEALDGVEAVELAINTDTPAKPFLQLIVVTQ